MELGSEKALALVLCAVVGVTGFAVYSIVIMNQPDVRIGYLTKDLHQLALQVAYAKGWFEDENLSVELVQYANGAYEMDGFMAGQIDMGYLGIAPAMTKRVNQGIGVTILAAANLEGSALMVHKGLYESGNITSVSDLVGKTILQPGPSTVQNFLLRLALEQHNVSIQDVLLETARPQDMAISLSEERPAFIAWEPFPALAEYNGLAVPLLLSRDIWPLHPCCVLAVSDSFLAAHPDRVEKVVKIHKMAIEWITQHPEEALTIATQWLESPQAPVETAFNRIVYTYTLNVTDVRRYAEFLSSQGLIDLRPEEIDPFLDEFVNPEFIEA